MQQKESKTNHHFRISLAKSGTRIAAGIWLGMGDLLVAGTMLVIAEILGILEEL
jgi:hypothetical protein